MVYCVALLAGWSARLLTLASLPRSSWGGESFLKFLSFFLIRLEPVYILPTLEYIRKYKLLRHSPARPGHARPASQPDEQVRQPVRSARLAKLAQPACPGVHGLADWHCLAWLVNVAKACMSL